MTYNYFRLFLSEHSATRSLHLSRSLANVQSPCQLTPAFFDDLCCIAIIVFLLSLII